MPALLASLYSRAPHWVQNLMVTGYDLSYYRRRGGEWKRYCRLYERLLRAPAQEHEQLQRERLCSFLRFVRDNSPFYRERWEGIDLEQIRGPRDLLLLPVVTKEELRCNGDRIVTVPRRRSYGAHTGGTTGASLEVRYTWPGFQERQAILDTFRGWHGWRPGARTAWFSGKTLLGPADEARQRYWKTDWWFNIRYYSTFHLTPATLGAYIDNLNQYNPRYLSGFPSNVFEIADYARRSGKPITCRPTAFFSTAETLLPHHSAVIEEQFGTRVVDQYSSSEGAPFIVMCPRGRLHLLSASGVIEVLDENGKPSLSGEAVVTSFHTTGTPLVRYRIGDRITLAPPGSDCTCGCGAPLVARIEGREQDGVWSRERGRINLGNISNCVKYTPAIARFQLVQRLPDALCVLVEAGPQGLPQGQKERFLSELRDRVGPAMALELHLVERIEREPGGKFRMVRNLLAPQQMGSAPPGGSAPAPAGPAPQFPDGRGAA